MASTAEVDLLVNATRTLPGLERDLAQVLAAAQAGADDIDVDAALRTSQSLADISRDLDRVITAADNGADDIDIDAVLNQRATINALRRDLDGVVTTFQRDGAVDPLQIRGVLNGSQTLRDVRGELDAVVRAAQATAPDIDIDVDLDTDRLQRGLRTLTTSLGRGASAMGQFGASATLAGSALGALPGLIAGVVGAVQQIAPAAAVATTGLLAVQLATGAVKLGMIGVSEAVAGAFDPDAKPEALAKQMKALAPEARKTVEQIVKLKGAFKDLQQDVQNRLFKDFDGVVKDLSTSVLPQLGKQLGVAATTLNQMGHSAAAAASELGDSGVLGQALKSANAGIKNLADVPAQVVTAFGELAAAAGPSFERITKAAAGVADKVAASLTNAFKSGGLQDAIDSAINSVAQLGRIAGNVFDGLGNIIDAVSVDGQGLFGTLEKLTQGFQNLTATKEFQAGLRALSETMAVLYETAGPLLAEALKIVARVLVELSGPAKELITLIGDQLGDIFKELGPVLLELAGTVGKLIGALSPLLKLAGELVAALLPSLTPLLKTLGTVFKEMTPFIAEVASILGSLLLPVLEKLPGFLEVILAPFDKFVKEIFPVLVEQLERMAPDFEELGKTMADLLEDLAPLIRDFLSLVLLLDEKLIPIIAGALIGTLALLAKALNGIFKVLDEYVIPSVQFWIDLLQGDFQDANVEAWTNVFKLRDNVILAFNQIVGGVAQKMNEYSTKLRDKVNTAADGFQSSIQDMIDNAVSYIGELPGRAASALGDLGGLLYGAGQSIISGLINGLQSKIGEVRSTLGELTGLIPDWKGPMDLDKRLLTPSGVALMDGLIAGIQKAVPRVQAELQGLTVALPGMTTPSAVSAPVLAQPAGSMRPLNVQVYLGDEEFNTRMRIVADGQIQQYTRIAAQGVRR